MRRIGEIIDELDLRGTNDELIKELVTLSTKHGVLTPYTSFLADDQAPAGELAKTESGARRAAGLLNRLEEAEGRAAFAQREAKKRLKEAQLTAPAADALVGGKFGGRGAVLRDIDEDRDVVVQAVQVVGHKVLYKRGNVWYSFDVARQDAEKVAAKAKVVERFSKEYFELVGKASPADAKLLSRQQAGEELMLEVDGDVYHVK
jgi:Ca-activated chloride channel family protein